MTSTKIQNWPPLSSIFGQFVCFSLFKVTLRQLLIDPFLVDVICERSLNQWFFPLRFHKKDVNSIQTQPPSTFRKKTNFPYKNKIIKCHFYFFRKKHHFSLYIFFEIKKYHLNYFCTLLPHPPAGVQRGSNAARQKFVFLL